MSDNYPVYGPQVKRPLRVRVLRIASVVLAFAGLILLYLYSVNRDIPLVRIDSITPTMNFAYVRIAGEVTRDAYVFQSGGVVFNLNDGSGEIAVMGGRAQAEALEDAGRLPRRGDRVEVAGSLSVSADQEVKLRMQSAEQLVLQRKQAASSSAPETSSVRLKDITAAQKGDQVFVSGVLKEVNVPGPGSKAPYVLTLEQDGTQLEVIFWDKVFQGLERKLPMPGKTISALGRVDVYKGKIQLKVWEAADLQEIKKVEKPMPDGSVTSIADITAAQKGDVFTVVGTLGEPRSIPGGVIYPIADESGEMVVLFWDKKVSGEERDALESGVRLRVTAPLVVYKGTLELVPEDVGAFSVEESK
jgi:DNA/RNA endonuclease YhcR with UshA esterase domain